MFPTKYNEQQQKKTKMVLRKGGNLRDKTKKKGTDLALATS